MPFKSEKQRKWMWANDPEMAKKWEKEEKMKKETKVRQLIKKMVREIMNEDFGGAFPKEKRDSFNKMRQKQSEVLGYKLMGTPDIKTEIDDATVTEIINLTIKKIKETKKRDYKAEYKKYGSSTKAKKYRAELNKYNRQKGTYGNGDKKDASHKNGKIVGFEEQSKNRGRAEKSRLKKEGGVGSGRPRAATPATDKDDKRPTKNPFSKESPAHKTWKKKKKAKGYIDKDGNYHHTGGDKLKSLKVRKEGKLKEITENFLNFNISEKLDFGKVVNKYNKHIVDNALALAKQHAIKDKHRGSKQTPKLIAIKTINRMKEYRNKTKGELKILFQKTINKLEKDYKRIKEGKNKGLWHNIHKKRKRGEKPAKKGDKNYPKTLDIEGKLNEKKETIFDVAERVMKDRQAQKYKSGRGQVMVDMQSANLLTKVWKKINPKMKKILSDLGYKNPAQLMNTLWAVAKSG